jgi:F0F1-type ATP synthase assembly protein I
MSNTQLKLPSKNNKVYYSLTIALSIVILLVSPVLSLLIIGYFIDNFSHTTPTFMSIGVVLGFLGSLVNITKLLKVVKEKKD